MVCQEAAKAEKQAAAEAKKAEKVAAAEAKKAEKVRNATKSQQQKGEERKSCWFVLTCCFLLFCFVVALNFY